MVLDRHHLLLLRACVATDRAIAAETARRWLDREDVVDTVDGVSFLLLPLLAQALRRHVIDHPMRTRLEAIARIENVRWMPSREREAEALVALRAFEIEHVAIRGHITGANDAVRTLGDAFIVLVRPSNVDDARAALREIAGMPVSGVALPALGPPSLTAGVWRRMQNVSVVRGGGTLLVSQPSSGDRFLLGVDRVCSSDDGERVRGLVELAALLPRMTPGEWATVIDESHRRGVARLTAGTIGWVGTQLCVWPHPSTGDALASLTSRSSTRRWMTVGPSQMLRRCTPPLARRWVRRALDRMGSDEP